MMVELDVESSLKRGERESEREQQHYALINL